MCTGVTLYGGGVGTFQLVAAGGPAPLQVVRRAQPSWSALVSSQDRSAGRTTTTRGHPLTLPQVRAGRGGAGRGRGEVVRRVWLGGYGGPGDDHHHWHHPSDLGEGEQCVGDQREYPIIELGYAAKPAVGR